MPSRTEVIERLRDVATYVEDSMAELECDVQPLRDAADLLEGGESRTEHRVVADFAPGDCSITLLGPDDIDGGEAMFREAAAGYRHGGVYKNPRAQKRTVPQTEWTDLEEADQ